MIVQRLFGVALAFTGCAVIDDGGPYFIPGSAMLDECSEPPEYDLTGRWFDSGLVTIQTEGCADTVVGERLRGCGLDWEFVQTGNLVEILVDEEYRITGRLCGSELQLEGGWWLPVEDAGECTYEDDSAAEVSLEATGNTLDVLSETEMAGTLFVRERCRARFEVSFRKFGGG
ncbi:MAG: hypothetical protein AAGE52_04185 [Myxococcota bacterium]